MVEFRQLHVAPDHLIPDTRQDPLRLDKGLSELLLLLPEVLILLLDELPELLILLPGGLQFGLRNGQIGLIAYSPAHARFSPVAGRHARPCFRTLSFSADAPRFPADSDTPTASSEERCL